MRASGDPLIDKMDTMVPSQSFSYSVKTENEQVATIMLNLTKSLKGSRQRGSDSCGRILHDDGGLD